jgi:hypothetical protein
MLRYQIHCGSPISDSYEKPMSGEHSPYPSEREILVFDETPKEEEIPQPRKKSLGDSDVIIFDDPIEFTEIERNKRPKSLEFSFETKLNEVDLSKYKIFFESIYCNKQMKLEFEKHLKRELNSDSWNFLMEIEKFQNLKEEKEFISLFHQIYYDYIQPDSFSQIMLNLSLKEKK